MNKNREFTLITLIRFFNFIIIQIVYCRLALANGQKSEIIHWALAQLVRLVELKPDRNFTIQSQSDKLDGYKTLKLNQHEKPEIDFCYFTHH